MQNATRAVITRAGDRRAEFWDAGAPGRLIWHTLFAAGMTPTNELTAMREILQAACQFF